MAKGKQPKDGKPAPRRQNPATRSRLGQKVHERKRSQIKGEGRGPGRPRTDERLKAVVLACLRKGLFLRTAMDIAGIGASVLQRWRAEPPGPDGMDFGMEMATARAASKLVAADALMKLIQKGDAGSVRYFLSTRTKEFGPKSESVSPLETGRQMRAFIEEAMSSRVGTPDTSQIEGWDDEDQDSDGEDWGDDE